MATDKLSCLSVEPGWQKCCCSMANQGLLDTSFGFGFWGSEVVVMVPTQMQRVALPFVGSPACGVVEGWDAQANREI